MVDLTAKTCEYRAVTQVQRGGGNSNLLALLAQKYKPCEYRAVTQVERGGYSILQTIYLLYLHKSSKY
jgi:hypothetical protein